MSAAAVRAPGAGSVHAETEVAAELVRVRTRVRRLRVAPPLVLRWVEPATLYLVSVGAGPVAGDRLSLRIRVGAGAALTVRQIAASVALPGPPPCGPSRFEVAVRLEEGARLDWLGEPTIAACGCDHDSVLRADLDAGATLCWREEVVAGRFGETGGLLRSHMDLTRGDRPLLRTMTTVGDRIWHSPAGGGGARVLGTYLVAGDDAAALTPPGGEGTALLRPADDLAVVTALGDAHQTVRAVLERMMEAIRLR